jgi:basic membrane protein A
MSVIALDVDRLADSKCLIADHPDVVSKVREVAAAIINGSLTLSDPMFAQ